MQYRKAARAGVELSVVALGGHEFLADGSSRGFNENFLEAVTPGHIYADFGGAQRQRIVAAALERGINFFDVTIDSEKEALGRNLRDVDLPFEVYVQTRPEGMVYRNNPEDPHNTLLLDYGRLRANVQRGLGLLRRECVEFLNFGIMKSALKHTPEYLDILGENIGRLKQEGLIRFASADTFSGETAFLALVNSGHFDSIFVNFNIADSVAREKLFGRCAELGVGVVCREVVVKGRLFGFAEEAGITDRTRVVRGALRWNLQIPYVTSVAVGVGSVGQLEADLEAVEAPDFTGEDRAILDRIAATASFKEHAASKEKAFREGGGWPEQPGVLD